MKYRQTLFQNFLIANFITLITMPLHLTNHITKIKMFFYLIMIICNYVLKQEETFQVSFATVLFLHLVTINYSCQI